MIILFQRLTYPQTQLNQTRKRLSSKKKLSLFQQHTMSDSVIISRKSCNCDFVGFCLILLEFNDEWQLINNIYF